MNIIISRNLGPEVVTQYNISHRYFNLMIMIAGLALGNIWSAFTDAYAQKNFEWMRRIASILQKALLAGIPVIVIMYFLATPFINLWIDKKVIVPAEINICEAIIFCKFLRKYIHVHDKRNRQDPHSACHISYICRYRISMYVMAMPSLWSSRSTAHTYLGIFLSRLYLDMYRSIKFLIIPPRVIGINDITYKFLFLW